ncbi:hypothetical protein G3M58_36665 [Streptomyces sp. SID7499]|uniref:Uncharacterized protein n=1 Tax=Streptomyces sp. SID7499 TaxID=2706086 RepID=A0A6G3X2V2_9ACTN|nr:hypothetical protein [Streptomyces sp. SID7499]
MKICARCNMPLRDGDDFDSDYIPSASGAGITIYRHRQPCKRTDAPTTQADLRH